MTYLDLCSYGEFHVSTVEKNYYSGQQMLARHFATKL